MALSAHISASAAENGMIADRLPMATVNDQREDLRFEKHLSHARLS
jgi:hypothetical protein